MAPEKVRPESGRTEEGLLMGGGVKDGGKAVVT